jgi:hypothetical protein
MRLTCRDWFVLLLTVSLATLGCGTSEPTPTEATTAAVGATAATAPSDPVGRVAYEFLDAVRRGDTAAASARLTPLALKRTSELDLNFSPPGSPTATFQVGEVEIIEADKAVVESVWTDRDADGKPNEESIIWALRLTEGQWRISGMAAELGEGQPSVVIDFENPDAFVQQPPKANAPGGQPAAGAGQKSKSGPSDRTAGDPFQQPVSR